MTRRRAAVPSPDPDLRGTWLHRPLAQTAKYWAVGRVTVRTNLAYLGEFLVRNIYLVVIMFVFFQLWRTTYRVTGTALISGFSLRGMIWYLAMSEALTVSAPRVGAVVDEDVKTGQLAYTLIRPHSYLLYLFATYMGEAAVRLPSALVVSGAIAWVTVGPPVLTWSSLPGLAAAVALALAMNFAISAGIGLLAFWFEDTSSFYLIYSRLLMIIGGVLIPLDVFPGVVRRVALALPTNLIIYGPSRLFVGHGASAAEVWRLLGSQAVWLAILGAGLSSLYRLGVKRVNVQGG